MNKWRSVKNDPPPKDGTEVMFCRRPPFSATGNHVIGFWHAYQNTPGWESVFGTILEEHYPYWQSLPTLPAEKEG